MLARKKETVVEPSAGELIGCGMTTAQAVIERRVQQIKAGQDGSSLPIGSIRQMVTGNGSCVCKIAQRLLDEERREKEKQ